MQWLSGADARMARAAAQVMGVFAEVEGARFGRRVPSLLQTLLPALERAALEVWCGECLPCYKAEQHCEGLQPGQSSGWARQFVSHSACLCSMGVCADKDLCMLSP